MIWAFVKNLTLAERLLAAGFLFVFALTLVAIAWPNDSDNKRDEITRNISDATTKSGQDAVEVVSDRLTDEQEITDQSEEIESEVNEANDVNSASDAGLAGLCDFFDLC